ncbi:MAG: alpha/beta hydrolase [Ruminococcaceae bacterium]|nr:alpha/beta hydrolase [Oscillospiraceae bacterium]
MKHYDLHLKEYYPILGEEGCDPTVEVYLPTKHRDGDQPDPIRPCLLICPGGSYAMCSRRESEPIALSFTAEGMNVFVLTYSPAPHRFPTQLREVAASLELIYAHAEEWNCDVSRIAIMGFSAGGHLAAHYSTSFDCAEVREVFPDSKAVKASLLAYPVITADPSKRHTGSFVNLLGHEPNEEEIERFSCDKLVSEKTPPTFLWHTAADELVPVANSLLYASALARYGTPFELHIYPFGGHGLATVDWQTCPDLNPLYARGHGWMDEAKKWLKDIL